MIHIVYSLLTVMEEMRAGRDTLVSISVIVMSIIVDISCKQGIAARKFFSKSRTNMKKSVI